MITCKSDDLISYGYFDYFHESLLYTKVDKWFNWLFWIWLGSYLFMNLVLDEFPRLLPLLVVFMIKEERNLHFSRRTKSFCAFKVKTSYHVKFLLNFLFFAKLVWNLLEFFYHTGIVEWFSFLLMTKREKWKIDDNLTLNILK